MKNVFEFTIVTIMINQVAQIFEIMLKCFAIGSSFALFAQQIEFIFENYLVADLQYIFLISPLII